MPFRSIADRGCKALLALLLVCCAACRPEAAAESLPWPRQSVLAGDGAAIRQVLERIERMKGTPLARHAAELREKLAGCEEFAISAAPGDTQGLAQSARCAPLAEQPAAVRALKEDGNLVFVLEVGAQVWLAGNAQVSSAGAVAMRARLVAEDGSSALARWLVPDDAPPGPARLSQEATLLHARFNPAAGLDIAGLVGAGSQGDDMFRLKSEVFSSAVLSGPWEAAVYVPPAGRFLPPLALAADVHFESAAQAAMQKFVGEIVSRWPMRRQPLVIGEQQGECLPELQLIPDLVPCYLLSSGALLLGSSPEALHIALSRKGDPVPVERGGFVLHLHRFAEADARLQKRTGARAPDPGFAYPWAAVAGEISREGEQIRVRMKLGAESDS